MVSLRSLALVAALSLAGQCLASPLTDALGLPRLAERSGGGNTAVMRLTSDGKPDNPYSQAFGTYLGEYSGCGSYSNGSTGHVGPYGDYGYQYQCVEYVNRFYATVLGHRNMKGSGNANQYYGKAGALGLDAYPNGGSVPPQEGDILCSNGGTYGHVAIVRAVYGDSVHVIHQNWLNDYGDADKSLGRSGNSVSAFGSTGSYPVVGWLRKPGAPPPCPQPDRPSLIEPQDGGWYSVSGGVPCRWNWSGNDNGKFVYQRLVWRDAGGSQEENRAPVPAQHSNQCDWTLPSIRPGEYWVNVEVWCCSGRHHFGESERRRIRADGDSPGDSEIVFTPPEFAWVGAEAGRPVRMDVTCHDATSGVDHARVMVRRENAPDGDLPGPHWTELGAFQGATGTVTWNTTGWAATQYHIHVDAYDKAGNHGWSPCFHYELKGDAAPPQDSEIVFTPPEFAWVGAETGEPVTMDVTCHDATSGIARGEVWVRHEDEGDDNPGPWWHKLGEFNGPGGPIVWNTTGWPADRYHIHVDAYDKAGNHGWWPCFHYELKLDDVPPQDSEIIFTPPDHGWVGKDTGQQIEVHVTCHDALSGIRNARVWVRKENPALPPGTDPEWPGEWWTELGGFDGPTGTITWDTTGREATQYHVHVDAYDNAGNHGWWPCFHYTLQSDPNPPGESTIVFDPSSPGLVGSAVRMQVQCTDAESGVARGEVWVRKENPGLDPGVNPDWPGDWWTKIHEFTGDKADFTWDTSGLEPTAYHIHVDAWDNAGNHGWWPCFHYDLSKYRPDLLIHPSDTQPEIGGNLYEQAPARKQVLARKCGAGRKVVYCIRLQNDGIANDGFVVRGTGGNRKWTVKYFDAWKGGHNYTGRVTGVAGWCADSNMVPAANLWFRVEVTPNAGTPKGARRPLDVTVESLRDGRMVDAVKLITTVGSGVADAAARAPAQVEGLAAAPTSAGAQFTFTLSAPATVQARVLNMAGRAVRTICQATACEAGTNTLLWNAQSDAGLAVPSGTYLVEVVARGDGGSQSRALARVTINR